MAVLLLTLVVLYGRSRVLASYRASAGDGLQYYQLAQSLRLDGRLAFARPPAPLAHGRLPGYPLFLAALTAVGGTAAGRGAEGREPLTLASHLRWATGANLVLDGGSALLTALLLARFGQRRRVALAAGLLVLVCPVLVFLSAYGLSESLATFLTVAALTLALLAVGEPRARRCPVGACFLAGAVAGLGLLVRVDALTTLPAAWLAFRLLGGARWRRLVLAHALGVLLVFAPWPLRNLLHIGAPHVLGAPWLDQSGRALPLGMMRWMLTFGRGAPGESLLILRVAESQALDPRDPGVLTPTMYDTQEERARIAALYAYYNRWGLAAADWQFSALARTRLQRAPLRTLLVLPLQRLRWLWSPLPAHELPMKVAWLGLPEWRWAYDALGVLLLVPGLWGATRLWRQGPRGRALVLVFGAAVVGRSVFYCYAHPFPVQRYLAEAMPALLALSACALPQRPGDPRPIVDYWMVLDRPTPGKNARPPDMKL